MESRIQEELEDQDVDVERDESLSELGNLSFSTPSYDQAVRDEEDDVDDQAALA